MTALPPLTSWLSLPTLFPITVSGFIALGFNLTCQRSEHGLYRGPFWLWISLCHSLWGIQRRLAGARQVCAGGCVVLLSCRTHGQSYVPPTVDVEVHTSYKNSNALCPVLCRVCLQSCTTTTWNGNHVIGSISRTFMAWIVEDQKRSQTDN